MRGSQITEKKAPCETNMMVLTQEVMNVTTSTSRKYHKGSPPPSGYRDTTITPAKAKARRSLNPNSH